MADSALYEKFNAAIDACTARHARALEPMSRLTSMMTGTGGATTGMAATATARGAYATALISLAVAAVLLIPMSARVVRRHCLRRDLARIRKALAACPVRKEAGDA